MGDDSKIEWTDATWNPVRGCVEVSPGCANCYAKTFAERFRGVEGHPYAQGFDLRLVPEKLKDPLGWKRPRRIFVNSMSDLFQDGVPDEFVDRVFAVMALAPQHTFQVLTKRAERMRDYLASRSKSATYWKAAARTFGYALEFGDVSLVPFPLPNVWLGVSVENQRFADERIPLLLETSAVVRFISAEPLLGPVDVDVYLHRWTGRRQRDRLEWVIVGGESGPNARPFDVAWARGLIRQCRSASVPIFAKQLGARAVGWWSNPLGPRIGKLAHRKGGDPADWPADLRVREFPEARR